MLSSILCKSVWIQRVTDDESSDRREHERPGPPTDAASKTDGVDRVKISVP